MAINHRVTSAWVGAIGGLIGGVFAPVSCFVSCQAKYRSDEALAKVSAGGHVAGGDVAGRDIAGRDITNHGLSEQQIKEIAREVIRLQMAEEANSDFAAPMRQFYTRAEQFRLEGASLTGRYDGDLSGHVIYDGPDRLSYVQMELGLYDGAQTRIGSATVQFQGVTPGERISLTADSISLDLPAGADPGTITEIRVVSVMSW